MDSIARLLLLALSGLFLVTTPAAAQSRAPVAVTSIEFEQSVLDTLGAVVELAGTAPAQLTGQVGFAATSPETLLFVAPGGDFEGFAGGELRHSGTLVEHGDA